MFVLILSSSNTECRCVSLRNKLTEVRYVGLLCDDVTDIAVMEQFITFVQFVDPETASLETKFLFVENALENSPSKPWETEHFPVFSLFFHLSLPKIWQVHPHKNHIFKINNDRSIASQSLRF